jgi:hypothetical protein
MTEDLEFNSLQGQEISLFSIASRPALWPMEPPVEWVTGLKLLRHEADQSLLSNTKIKYTWSYTSVPSYVFPASCLIKHKDNFTFSLYI